MYHEFKDLGEIDEVFIPFKRTRWGKKYGFVRFLNVKDEKLLKTKLDNLFLGEKKIFANLPKFERKHNVRKFNGLSVSGKTNPCSSPNVEKLKGGSNVVKWISFAQMLKGDTSMVVREFVLDEGEKKNGKSLHWRSSFPMDDIIYARPVPR